MTTFSGTVYGPDGNVQTNAPVVIINSDTDSVETETTTDSNGQYSVDVPGGPQYHVATRYDDGSGNQFTALSKPFIGTTADIFLIDSFEDSNIEEYVVAPDSDGTKSNFSFETTTTYDGSVALRQDSSQWTNIVSHPNGSTPTVLPNYPDQGDIVKFYTYCEAGGNVRFQFGVQNATNRDDLYNVRFAPRDGEFTVRVRQNGGYVQTEGPTSGQTLPTGVWCEITIDWYQDTNGDTVLDVVCTNLSTNSDVVSVQLVDTSVQWTGGGIGWGFWSSTTQAKIVDYVHISA